MGHLAQEQGSTVEETLPRWGQAITFLFDLADEARHDIFHYIEVFYNRKRRHSALGYTSPDQFEKSRKMCAN